MKLFACPACKAVVFFENVLCTACGGALAYRPDLQQMVVPARTCANAQVCNWVVTDDGPYCLSCRFNDIVPTDVALWARFEAAKRRLFYTLLGLGLPLIPKKVDARGLEFKFVADGTTGHTDGVIAINIDEARPDHREHVREALGETYRTLLGHFRHESGHYYWQRLIAPAPDRFRAVFGDERADYAAAQQRHYHDGPAADWRTRYVSAYASMHPWEDWSETWAHYLHMIDTLETARSYGLALRPPQPIAPVVARKLDFDDFDDLLNAWVPLTLALNSLNRSMGQPDPYAFVLSTYAIDKLRFVHDVVEGGLS